MYLWFLSFVTPNTQNTASDITSLFREFKFTEILNKYSDHTDDVTKFYVNQSKLALNAKTSYELEALLRTMPKWKEGYINLICIYLEENLSKARKVATDLYNNIKDKETEHIKIHLECLNGNKKQIEALGGDKNFYGDLGQDMAVKAIRLLDKKQTKSKIEKSIYTAIKNYIILPQIVEEAFKNKRNGFSKYAKLLAFNDVGKYKYLMLLFRDDKEAAIKELKTISFNNQLYKSKLEAEFNKKSPSEKKEDEILAKLRGNDPEGYYSKLGVKYNVSQGELKNAYRKQIAAIHSNKQKPEANEKKLTELNKAFDALSSIEKREKYDNGGGRMTSDQFNQYQNFNNHQFDFENIFRGMFTGAFDQRRGFGHEQRENRGFRSHNNTFYFTM